MLNYEWSNVWKCKVVQIGRGRYPYTEIFVKDTGGVDVILVGHGGAIQDQYLVFLGWRFRPYPSVHLDAKIENGTFLLCEGKEVKYRFKAVHVSTAREWTRSAMPYYDPTDRSCIKWMDEHIPDWQKWPSFDGRRNEAMLYAFTAKEAFLYFFSKALVD